MMRCTRTSSKRNKKTNKKLSQKKEERLNEVRHKRQEIEERKQEIYKERRKAAQSLRIKRMKNDQKKYEFLNEVRMQNAAKKELIKTQEKQASIHLENLKRRHIMEVQNNNKNSVLSEKELIRRREREAQRLERLEAELLQNLQQTQLMEKEAFSQLEHAMIDASRPKRDRINNRGLSKSSSQNR
uniref:Uncharacterized protein n=1 Tax=Euplotes harpa TaxID=151035 RepID=A0A7S3NAU6_9SPIT|mmetsp:Transcript_31444/g.35928  ORF Transcript_31444/g.35928 Transcript_31444/m.35928 type:complete len:185 (+) Transcript_31444:383-937(+)